MEIKKGEEYKSRNGQTFKVIDTENGEQVPIKCEDENGFEFHYTKDGKLETFEGGEHPFDLVEEKIKKK